MESLKEECLNHFRKRGIRAKHLSCLPLSLQREFKNCCRFQKIHFVEAVEFGHVECFKRAKDKVGHNVLMYAAQFGQIKFSRWALKNGYQFHTFGIEAAVQHNRVEYLQWAQKEHVYFPKSLCRLAAYANSFEALKWLVEEGYEWDGNEICAGAAKHGNWKMIAFAKKLNMSWDFTTCENAAKYGHFEFLKWCRREGCPWSDGAIEDSAEAEHWDIVFYLIENNCPVSWSACVPLSRNFEALQAACNKTIVGRCFDGVLADVIKIGDDRCVDLLIAKGAPVNKWAALAAARSGKFELLKKFHQEGCPLSRNVALAIAETGNLDAFKWLVSCLTDVEDVYLFIQDCCFESIPSGSIELVAYCIENGATWSDEYYKVAKQYHHVELVAWAKSNGF